MKCPFSAKDNPPESGKKIPKKLKKAQYVRQIQGQMACVGVKWGLLIVWTPQKMYIDEIEFNGSVWAESMCKLDRFWHNALAPELEDSRVVRGDPIREWRFEDADIHAK